MNLNKKILFSTIIIVIFVIAIFTMAFFYWPETQRPETQIPSDTSYETAKEECLENVAKMTDEELIDKVKNLENPYEETDIVGSSGRLKDRMSWAQNQMSRYLICQVKINSNNDNIYNRAKKFIGESGFEEEYEDSRQIYLAKLERARSNPLDNNFTVQLALGDLKEICPEKLTNLCLEEVNQFDIETKKLILDDCQNICDLIDQYAKDGEKLEKEIIGNKEWSWAGYTNDESLQEKQHRFRLSIAYRFGGQDLAVKICDDLDIDKNDECLDWINFLEKENTVLKECHDAYENLKHLICQLPVN